MFRRLLFIFAFLLSLCPLRAVVWQSAEYGVGVSLPDGPDWTPMPEATTPTMRVLAAVINEKTSSMFNITLQTGLAGKKLEDPAVAEAIKKDLTAAGYQIFGYSKTGAGLSQWLQFPVDGGGAKGVVRATAANGQIFTVTLLRGDGKNALQDTELMRAGASFRITAPAVAPAPPTDAAPPTEATPKPAGQVKTPATPEAPVAETSPIDYTRIGIAGAVLVVLLLLAWGIVGTGKK